MVSTSVITLITALVGGSRYGVSSPTGPMTAAIAVILLMDQQWLQTHHSTFDHNALLNLTLIISGLILLFLVLLRVHKLVKLVPNLVVSGFVNGIALLIILAQFKAIKTNSDIGLMLVTLLVALIVHQFSQKFTHLVTRIIASSLSVIVLMSIIALFIPFEFSYLTLESSFNSFTLDLPPLAAINFETFFIIFPLAFELALIALLDTLLTALIMDKKSGRKTQLSRELTGQGISLFGVSIIGGIPGAQSTVPSMMLLQEGGHHRYTKLLLAFFCIAFTFIFSNLIQYVPLAVFGGVILKIAYDVADFTAIKNLIYSSAQNKPLRIIIVLGTCLSTVLISLNLAVVGFTILFVLWNSISPKKFQITDLQPIAESEGLIDEV